MPKSTDQTRPDQMWSRVYRKSSLSSVSFRAKFYGDRPREPLRRGVKCKRVQNRAMTRSGISYPGELLILIVEQVYLLTDTNGRTSVNGVWLCVGIFTGFLCELSSFSFCLSVCHVCVCRVFLFTCLSSCLSIRAMLPELKWI